MSDSLDAAVSGSNDFAGAVTATGAASTAGCCLSLSTVLLLVAGFGGRRGLGFGGGLGFAVDGLSVFCCGFVALASIR